MIKNSKVSLLLPLVCNKNNDVLIVTDEVNRSCCVFLQNCIVSQLEGRHILLSVSREECSTLCNPDNVNHFCYYC